MHAHTFIPVNGRVPPCALADPLELDEVEVPLASEDGACASDELLVDGELLELEELDDDDELLLDEELLWWVLVVPVSGSTYWLSPAEVLVPAASTVAAPPNEIAASTSRHPTLRMMRRTLSIQPGAAVGQRFGWTR